MALKGFHFGSYFWISYELIFCVLMAVIFTITSWQGLFLLKLDGWSALKYCMNFLIPLQLWFLLAFCFETCILIWCSTITDSVFYVRNLKILPLTLPLCKQLLIFGNFGSKMWNVWFIIGLCFFPEIWGGTNYRMQFLQKWASRKV